MVAHHTSQQNYTIVASSLPVSLSALFARALSVESGRPASATQFPNPVQLAGCSPAHLANSLQRCKHGRPFEPGQRIGRIQVDGLLRDARRHGPSAGGSGPFKGEVA